MAWDDAKKAKAVEMYQEAEPTPENSMEIVKEIAEELEESPNGVRMILTKADVYIKKADSKSSNSGGGNTAAKSTRVSKEDAHNRLTQAIEKTGSTADSDIVSKMTGKAALYFAEIIESSTNGDDHSE